MKTLMTVIMMSLLASLSYAGDKGNGGGGIVRDGRYMTFHSAGFTTESESMNLSDLPEVTRLMRFFGKEDFLFKNTQNKLFEALMPGFKRRYFRVKKETFTKQTRSRLIAEYQRVTGFNADTLTLFAITDTSKGITYLLPEFFELEKETERMAILFHEAYWLIKPNASYDHVVDSEITLQSLLEDTSNIDAAIRLAQLMGGEKEALRTAYIFDKKLGNLLWLDKDYKISIDKFIGGENYSRYMLDHDYIYVIGSQSSSLTSHRYLVEQTSNLSLDYIDSAFLRLMAKYMVKRQLSCWKCRDVENLQLDFSKIEISEKEGIVIPANAFETYKPLTDPRKLKRRAGERRSEFKWRKKEAIAKYNSEIKRRAGRDGEMISKKLRILNGNIFSERRW